MTLLTCSPHVFKKPETTSPELSICYSYFGIFNLFRFLNSIQNRSKQTANLLTKVWDP